MDTIQQGNRLVIVPPGTAHCARRNRQTEAANLLIQIQSLLRLYNARVRRMSLTERAANNLTTVHFAQRLDGIATLVHHDSPAWAATIAPVLPSRPPHIGAGLYQRPMNPMSKAELRAYFLRKGGTKTEAWRRFPPSDSSEREQMTRDLATVKRVRSAPDPFEATVKRLARKRNRNPNDPQFRAEVQAELSAIEEILNDL